MYDADTNVASSEPGTSGATFHFAFPVKRVCQSSSKSKGFESICVVKRKRRSAAHLPLTTPSPLAFAATGPLRSATSPVRSTSPNVLMTFELVRTTLPAVYGEQRQRDCFRERHSPAGGKRPPRKRIKAWPKFLVPAWLPSMFLVANLLACLMPSQRPRFGSFADGPSGHLQPGGIHFQRSPWIADQFGSGGPLPHGGRSPRCPVLAARS